MPCSCCSNGATVEIRMQVNGSDLIFTRCGRCETQQWSSPEGRLALDDVLELARRP